MRAQQALLYFQLPESTLKLYSTMAARSLIFGTSKQLGLLSKDTSMFWILSGVCNKLTQFATSFYSHLLTYRRCEALHGSPYVYICPHSSSVVNGYLVPFAWKVCVLF